MTKYTSIAAGVAAASFILAAASQPADAAKSVKANLFLGEINQLSDNSGESQGVDLNSDGFLGVGDTLRGTLSFDTNEDKTGVGGTNALGLAGDAPVTDNELSGIFETVVTALTVTFDFDGSCGADPTCGGGTLFTGDELATFVFGSSAAFAAEFSLSAGAVAAFFEDPTPDYDRNLASIAAIEATATDGTLAFALGLFGVDADEDWRAFGAPVDTGIFTTTPIGTTAGTFNMQLSLDPLNRVLLPNIVQVAAGCVSIASPLFPCAGDGLIDFNASGSVSGTLGAASPYEVFDNVDFTFQPISGIPEPTTIGLLGAGLIGLGATALRRRRKAKANV